MTIEDLAANAALLWLGAALLLGIAELAIPGVFLVFLAIAAAVTAAITAAVPDLPVAGQIGAFALWSVIVVMIGRRWYRDFPVEGGDPMLNDRAARLIGEVVTVSEALTDGHGRVRVGDGEWPARGPDAPAGARMRIAAVEGGVIRLAPLPPSARD